jgi:hypothetical protein
VADNRPSGIFFLSSLATFCHFSTTGLIICQNHGAIRFFSAKNNIYLGFVFIFSVINCCF